jgi:hypothetical protein
MRPEGLSLKNSSDSIGNGTRNLPACSAVPQPTAPPRTPALVVPVVKVRMKAQYFILLMNLHDLLWKGFTLFGRHAMHVRIESGKRKEKTIFKYRRRWIENLERSKIATKLIWLSWLRYGVVTGCGESDVTQCSIKGDDFLPYRISTWYETLLSTQAVELLSLMET